MDEMRAKIKELIVSEPHLEDVAPASIGDTTALFGEGLGLDSLDALQLAVAVEEHFGVRIADETEGKGAFASVDALVQFIRARQPAAS